MVILGVDPGSRATGLGLIRIDGNRLSYLSHEVIRPKGDSLAGRLGMIYSRVAQRLAEWAPAGIAVESVFADRNPSAALKLGQARGAVLAACGAAGVSCEEYAPTRVKQAVAGSGHASKSQVQAMVSRLLALTAVPPTDAADALAVAICHGHSAASSGAKRLAAALAQGSRT